MEKGSGSKDFTATMRRNTPADGSNAMQWLGFGSGCVTRLTAGSVCWMRVEALATWFVHPAMEITEATETMAAVARLGGAGAQPGLDTDLFPSRSVQVVIDHAATALQVGIADELILVERRVVDRGAGVERTCAAAHHAQ